ncbi:unnamed protein product [Rotaria sp. Silwood1]|nr:unnamed protein product [Rotaria sp. Silwood1]
MTKRSSKKVLKITNTRKNQLDASSVANDNTTNFDYSSSINSSSDSIPPSATVLSTKSKENMDVVLETGKYFKQKWSPVFVSKVFDIDDDENNNHNQSQSLLSSQTTNKRKVPPTKNSKKGKRFKNSSNNKTTTTTTTTTIDSDDDNNDKDEENIDHQSNEPSNVWKYATRSRDKKFAICKICSKRISTNNWSTTCLRRHLILKHDKYELILSNEKTEATSTISPIVKENIHKLSIEAIIKDNLPFNAFMKSGLAKLMKKALPGYQPIHRNVVTRRLKRLNQQKHNKLIEELKPIETITLSMDFWSDRSNRSFLVITGHYYTNNHQQKSKILSFCSFDYRHTSDQISKFVKKKLQQLHILHKVNRVVTDGARNLSNAIASMDLDADHIWCIAHRLHLAVTNALALWPKKREKVVGTSNNQDLKSYPNLNNLTISNGEQQLPSKQSNINKIDRHDQSNNNNHYNDDDDLVEEHLLMDNDNDEFVMTVGGTEVEDYQENDDSDDDDDYENDDDDYENDDYDYENDDDYENDENIENDEDIENDDNGDCDGNNNNGDDNDDSHGYRNAAINGFDDHENLLCFIEEEILDRWSENVQVAPNDPSLTNEQKLILFLMTKCRRLINMIRKSSVLTLHFNHQRKILKIKRNVLRDVCTRWNSTYFMIHSLIVVRPIIERLYNDKHNLNITNEQIEKLNHLEITTTEWNFLKQLRHVLRVFQKATKTISGQHYPTMGSAFFILTKLKTYLSKDIHDNSIVKNFKKLLMGKMIHYFDEDRTQLNLLKVSKRR